MHSNIFMSQIIIYISKMTEAVSRLSIEAKIKLKDNDWEVEIICAEDKVKQVVGNVLSGIDTALFSNTKIETEIENLKSELKDIKQKYESNSSNNNNNNILNNQFNQKRNNISLKELVKAAIHVEV